MGGAKRREKGRGGEGRERGERGKGGKIRALLCATTQPHFPVSKLEMGS